MSSVPQHEDDRALDHGTPDVDRATDASAASRELVVARLRAEIRRIEHRPGRREGAVPCGLPAVDAALPGGGFARGALAELAGGPASGKTAVALALLAALGREDLFAWIDGRGELYPPAAAARGVDLGRLLVVRPPVSPAGMPPPGAEPGWRGALWAAEAVLASGAFAAVVMDVPLPRTMRGSDAIARRLQAAVERGGAVGLSLTGVEGGLRIPGSVRLEVATDAGRIVARRTSGLDARARSSQRSGALPWEASGGDGAATRAGGGGRAA